MAAKESTLITETCFFCGKPFRVPRELRGKKVRCPHCKELIGISGAPPAAPAEQPAAPPVENEPGPAPEEVIPDLSANAEITTSPVYTPVPKSGLAKMSYALGWTSLVFGIVATVTTVALGLMAYSQMQALGIGGAVQYALIIGVALVNLLVAGVFCAVCFFVGDVVSSLHGIHATLREISAELGKAPGAHRST